MGLRQGERLELRRSDVDGVTGRIKVTRRIDKDVIERAKGACPRCGRGISAPKTRSGIRTVHVLPPFLPMLQKHLLEHGNPGDAKPVGVGVSEVRIDVGPGYRVSYQQRGDVVASHDSRRGDHTDP